MLTKLLAQHPKTLEEEDPELAAQLWKERKEKRLQLALSMFSKVDELLDDHARVFHSV